MREPRRNANGGAERGKAKTEAESRHRLSDLGPVRQRVLRLAADAEVELVITGGDGT
jgi:hypothetical protein